MRETNVMTIKGVKGTPSVGWRRLTKRTTALVGRFKWDLLSVVVICIGAAIAIRAFWQPGVASEADMLIGVYRLFELDQSWGEGIFFPRIAMGLNFGYGGPLFEYYSPLASYIALAFHWVGFGWIGATKAGFTLALLLAGIGAYVYARWLFADRRAALVAGFAYLLAPYLLVSIYQRGASAELLALGLVPWLFWTTHHMLCSKDRVWLVSSASLIALLVLAHNITALFVLPMLAFYLALLAWHEGSWHRLPTVGVAFGLGLGLSAFYWLPALAERAFSQLEGRMLGDSGPPEANLRVLGELFQASLAYDYWGGRRFHPALWQAIAGMVGLLAIVLVPRRLRFTLIVIVAALTVLYLLQLSISAAFWQATPLVRFIQFPWRLLGPVSFFSALLLGAALCWQRLAGTPGWAVAAILVLTIGYAGLRNLDPKLSTIWYPITDEQIGRKDLYERGARGYPLYNDYAPIAMQVGPRELTKPRAPGIPAWPPLPTRPTIQIKSEGGTCLSLQVQTSTPLVLRLPRIYFPNWRVSVSGRAAEIAPSRPLGLITVEIPPGEHPVEACFGNTPLRSIASAISVLALPILAIGGIRTRPNNRMVWGRAILVVALAMLALLHQGLGHGPRQPIAYTARFDDEINLLGYHLDKSVLRPGDTLDLRLYWLTSKTPAADYKVFVHLSKLDDSGTVAQIDEPPLLGQGFTSRWDPGEIVVDEHQLPIDGSVPPGRYRVLVGMYRPDTVRNLQVTGAPDVWPGDRVALEPIRITDLLVK